MEACGAAGADVLPVRPDLASYEDVETFIATTVGTLPA